MGIQLGDRPQPSGDRARTYDPGRGIDSAPPEIHPPQPMLWVTGLIFGLAAAVAVAWGIRAYVMPSNQVAVTLRMTPPFDAQTALKLDGALITAPDGILAGVLLDKPHRLEIYQPHYLPLLQDFSVHRRTDERYELEVKLEPLNRN